MSGAPHPMRPQDLPAPGQPMAPRAAHAPEPWPAPPPAPPAPSGRGAAALGNAPPPAPGAQPPAPAAPAAPAAGGAPPEPRPAPVPPFAPGTLEPDIIAALRTCFDPEIPLNIYDLSLIYGIDVDPDGNVEVRMTLTSPTCPVAGTLPGEVQQKVASVPGVKSAHVALVWDPPWEPSMLSEGARLQLGLP